MLKQWELQRKFESISTELSAWKALSEAGKPLEKHNRQIRRLSVALDGMLGVVQAEVKKLRETTDEIAFFQLLPRAEYVILEVHRVWQYFREKFTARQGPPFSTLLEALDEFVWECYHPAFVTAPEPPLTFFIGGRSPLASSRRETLVPEPTDDPGAASYTLLDDTRLQHLVIPVIGLPWFETAFLPEALLLAHETGHQVDFDLDLSRSIEANLSAASIDADRLANQWLPWSAEVFADLYGVLCLGPAFVGALQMLLSRSPSEVLNASDPRATYPPHHLRLLIALGGLRHLGFKTDADTLETQWRETYGDAEDFAHLACVVDIETVVTALLGTPFDALARAGKPTSFADLSGLAWAKSQQSDAEGLCARLVSSRNAPLGSANPRIVLAGAQLVFQKKPELLDASADGGGLHGRLVNHIVAGRQPGVRSRQTVTAQLPKPAQLEAADRARGQGLADALLSQFGPRP